MSISLIWTQYPWYDMVWCSVPLKLEHWATSQQEQFAKEKRAKGKSTLQFEQGNYGVNAQSDIDDVLCQAPSIVTTDKKMEFIRFVLLHA